MLCCRAKGNTVPINNAQINFFVVVRSTLLLHRLLTTTVPRLLTTQTTTTGTQQARRVTAVLVPLYGYWYPTVTCAAEVLYTQMAPKNVGDSQQYSTLGVLLSEQQTAH